MFEPIYVTQDGVALDTAGQDIKLKRRRSCQRLTIELRNRILTGLAQGKTYAAIAAELSVSPYTIGNVARRQKQQRAERAMGPTGSTWRPTPIRSDCGDLSPAMTLSQFYERYFVPVRLQTRDTAPMTYVMYEISVRFWIKMTGDPPLAEIDQRTCAAFVQALANRINPRTDSPVSPNTIRRNCTHLQAVFNSAGPRGPYHRDAAGLLPEAPYLSRPPYRPKPPVDVFTLDEIRAWLSVCHLARMPRLPTIAAGTWWRSLILTTYNVGWRIGTALQVEWEMIHGESFSAPARIMKTHYGRDFHLNTYALEALSQLPHRTGIVFPFPHDQKHTLGNVRHELLDEAGIAADRHFGFHALRKALATHLAQANPLCAQLQLGHTAMQITRDHYVNPNVLKQVLDAVPQPSAAIAAPPASPEKPK